jgi:hypothetical protein
VDEIPDMRASRPLHAARASRKQALGIRSRRALMAMLAVFAGPVSAVDTAAEASVKAAFVYNFAKFIEWPASAAAERGSEVRICTAGLDAELASSVAALEGKSVQARTVSVKRDVKVAELDACRLLVLGTTAQALAESVRGKAGLLTISDVKGFAASGGIIELFVDAGKMRFEINTRAAEHAGLRISSQLLKLAKVTPEQ